jgi:hypothetical protein
MLFDVVIVALTIREWQHHRSRRRGSASSATLDL